MGQLRTTNKRRKRVLRAANEAATNKLPAPSAPAPETVAS